MTKYQGEERGRNVFKSEGSKKNSAKKAGSKKLNMKLPVLPDWPIEKIRKLTNDQIKKGLSQITLKRGYYGSHAQEPSQHL